MLGGTYGEGQRGGGPRGNQWDRKGKIYTEGGNTSKKTENGQQTSTPERRRRTVGGDWIGQHGSNKGAISRLLNGE